MRVPSAAPKSWLSKIPWGLFIVLAVYAAGVAFYVWTNYYDAPEYKAAQAWAKAWAVLGEDEGRSCSEAALNRGFDLLLETAALVPDRRDPVDELESLRYRFEERHFKLSKERRTAVEMLSARTRASLDAKKPWLLVGAHSKGWAPEQLLSGPRRTVLWSIPGAVFIVVFWLYTVFSRKRALADKHEAQLQESEREVEALGDFRRGLGAPPPSKIPPSKPPPPRTTRSGVTTTGRAVKRKP